jgi:RNA polymerase sigma-70 factor (ECF subfamily)
VAAEASVTDRDAQGARWRALMAAAQAGDAVAYRALLTEVTPWIRASARAMLRDAAEAEDALQDALLTLHQVRHTYDPERPFKPWLATVAKRRILDRLDGARRRQGRHAPVEAAETWPVKPFHHKGRTRRNRACAPTSCGRRSPSCRPASARPWN